MRGYYEGEKNILPGNINDTFDLPQGGGGGEIPPWDEPLPLPSPGPNLAGPNVPIINQSNPPPNMGGNPLKYDSSYPGSVNTTGAGSGVPTQNVMGKIGGTLGNMAFPGLGFLTGPLARMVTRMIQNGMSRQQVQQAVAQAQQGGGGSGGGGGLNFKWPGGLGGFGKPMGYFEPTGGFGSGDPGNYNPTGPMGPVGTFGIVNSSSPAGGGSFFGGRGSLSQPGGGNLGNLGGSGGNLGNFGNIIGNTELRHVLKFGQLPQDAFGASRGSWTPELAQHWGDVFSQRGYIYPQRGRMERTGMGLGGAGRPITKET